MPPSRRSRNRARLLRELVLLILLVAAAGARDAVGAQAQGAPPSSPAQEERPIPMGQRRAEWIPGGEAWETLAEATLRDAQGETWRLVSGRRKLGVIVSGPADVPVYLPRVVFQRIKGRDTTGVGALLPDGNADVSIRPPDDPEAMAVPSSETQDSWGRWPNPCAFTIQDTNGRIDLDDDGRIEVAIHRMCSCPSIACEGIVFVELGPEGASVLDPARLVEDVKVSRMSVREMISAADSTHPVLVGEPEILDDCRFIGLAGVRGRNPCKSCCTFPVLLRPLPGGRYATFYDYERQQAWKNRSRDLLTQVASIAGTGDTALPPTSEEEAQIAQAAAFFYFTGSARDARREIARILGPRARDYHFAELLRRLDTIFLP